MQKQLSCVDFKKQIHLKRELPGVNQMQLQPLLISFSGPCIFLYCSGQGHSLPFPESWLYLSLVTT